MITLLPVPIATADTWAALSRLPGPGRSRRGFLTEPIAETLPEADPAPDGTPGVAAEMMGE